MEKTLEQLHQAESEQTSWRYFLSYKATRSHVVMCWCAVVLFPVFFLLDYLVVDDLLLFLSVRILVASLLAAMLLLHRHFYFSSEAIAHYGCHVVMLALMWMLSQMKTPEQFAIYTLNTCIAYLASSVFLLWSPKHSIVTAISSAVAFIVLFVTVSPLTVTQIITHGILVLLTMVIMTQLYIFYRYKIIYRDFTRQMELNRAYEELKARNFEINQRNEEILLQKGKLEELNELKDRLFMIISHDFRSPLHSLKGLIILLNDHDYISAEEFKHLLKGLKQNVDQTYDLLENLLIWAKSQMQGAKVKPEKLQLNDLIEQNIALLKVMADKKEIRLLHDVSDDVMVYADADMIRLVFRNLITNAIKFTDTSGQVKIHAVNQNAHVIVSVEDNGIGIDEERQSRIFQSINSSTGTRKEKGTGLGLMICKEFVEKNGGTMWIESEPGKGSTFYFSLRDAVAEKKLAS